MVPAGMTRIAMIVWIAFCSDFIQLKYEETLQRSDPQKNFEFCLGMA